MYTDQKRKLDRRWLGVLALFVACGSTDERPEPTLSSTPRPLDSPALHEQAPSVLEQLELVPLERQQSADGFAVVFSLRSVAGVPLSLAYTVDWFDAHGEPVVDPQRLWLGLSLKGDEAVELRARAPQSTADSWKLRAVAYPWPPAVSP